MASSFLSVTIASSKVTVSSAGQVGFANATFVFDSGSQTSFLNAIGLAIGTNVQAHSANLDAISGIGFSNDVKAFLAALNNAAARASLGLGIGSDVQAYSANLAAIASIAFSTDVKSLLGAANNAAARTSLGLAIGSDVQPYSANLTTFAGIAPSSAVQAVLGGANNAAILTTLGLTIGTNVQAHDATLDSLSGKSIVGTGAIVTQSYVDSLAAGLGTKESVRVATTVNGDINTAFSNGQTIDGVVIATGDRILIKNQASPNQAQNGIYTVNATGAPTRATDFDTWSEIPGMLISVQEGTANADSLWLSTANQGGTLGTTAITFTNPFALALLATNNLSDVGDAATARGNLGVGIGTNVQAHSANLDAIAGIAFSANIKTLLAAANYAAVTALLGLQVGTNVPAMTVAGKYRIKLDGSFQIWNPDQGLFHSVTVSGASGAEVLNVVTPGES